MEEIDRDFAMEMISKYGEDRFYHCCKRTGGGISALLLHMDLNGSEKEESRQRLISIGINPFAKPEVIIEETGREIVCRIAYGFVRYYKEMGLKRHELPSSMNARMIFGEENKWVSGYVKLLDSFPNWSLDKILPE